MQTRAAICVFLVALTLWATMAICAAQDNDTDGAPVETTQDVDTVSQEVLNYEPQLPDRKTTGDTLSAILARPEFQGDEPEEPQDVSWNEKFFNWISRALGNLGVPGSSNTLGYVLIALLIGLVLFLIIRMALNIYGGRRFAKDSKLTVDLEKLSPDDLVAKAIEAAKNGDYQFAIRLRFKSVLGALKMPSSTVLTNSQVLFRLKRNMPFAEKPFRELSAIFEDTWYGRQPCSAVEYNLVGDFAGQIEQGLEGLKE